MSHCNAWYRSEEISPVTNKHCNNFFLNQLVCIIAFLVQLRWGPATFVKKQTEENGKMPAGA